MDLKGQLDRFKKQQERCQSTLSSINASRAPSGPSRPSSVPAAPSLKPTPPVKFSNDTERLQFINSIRKGPVGAQIKRVIELLFEVSCFFHFLCIAYRGGELNLSSFSCRQDKPSHRSRLTKGVMLICFPIKLSLIV